MRGSLRIWLAALMLMQGALPCTAATKVWLGTYGQTGYWSNGANWKDGTPPVNGDRVQFDLTMVYWDGFNDINGLVLDGIDFAGFNMEVHGNPITLTNSDAMTFTGSFEPLFFFPITLATPNPAITASTDSRGGNAPLDFPGEIVVNGGTFTINAQNWVLLGSIAETAPTSLVVNAPHFQVISDAFGMSGTVTFSGETFYAGGEALGSAAAATIQATDWVRFIVDVPGPLTTPLDLRITGPNPQFGFTSSFPPFSYSGPIAITGPHIFVPSADGVFSGAISGNGRLLASTDSHDPGHSITLSNPTNSFAGGAEVQVNGKLILVNTGSLPPSGGLAIDAGGIANLGAYSQTTNGFACAGTFEITAGASLNSSGLVNVTGCTLQFDVPSGYVPPGGSLTVVANSSGAAVTGTFAGLPEGAPVMVNGSARVITYRGGAGADIALTVPGTPHLSFDSSTYSVGEGQVFPVVLTYVNGAGSGVSGVRVTVGFACVPSQACITSADNDQLTNADGRATIHLTASFAAGSVSLSASDDAGVAHADANVVVSSGEYSAGSVQDMWWNPSENGWGMSLVQHNDTLFGAFYIYDANGRPMWVVMPGGAWDAGHGTYTGSLYEPSGAPFYAYDASNFIAGASVGSVSIAFADANNATVDYTIGSVSGRKFVTREIFANGSHTPADRSDLWWGGALQNGWGITVLQQANTLFAVWYTYDANGNRTWYVMPGGAWSASDTYEGALYRTTGSPWVGNSYDATKLQVTNAGTYKFQFNGDAATFTYSADGHGGSIPLTREPF